VRSQHPLLPQGPYASRVRHSPSLRTSLQVTPNLSRSTIAHCAIPREFCNVPSLSGWGSGAERQFSDGCVHRPRLPVYPHPVPLHVLGCSRFITNKSANQFVSGLIKESGVLADPSASRPGQRARPQTPDPSILDRSIQNVSIKRQRFDRIPYYPLAMFPPHFLHCALSDSVASGVFIDTKVYLFSCRKPSGGL